MANYGTILVVDDNTSIFTTLEICLDGVFDRILTLTKPENILTTLEQEAVDIILLEEHVRKVVDKCHGNISKAAELLEISRQRLYKKLGK